MHRNGRELVPTPKAFSLLFRAQALRRNRDHLARADRRLGAQAEADGGGKLPRDEFMDHIEQVTRDLVERIRGGDIPDDAFAIVPAPCPKCGGTVQENYRKFQCQKCDFSLWRVTASREWSPEEVAELISKRFVGPLTGFRSRMGKPFSAGVKLTDDFRAEFDFGQAGDENRGSAGFQLPGEPRRLPQVRRARVRARRGLRLRESGRARPQLRLPLRQDDPAAAGRARADAEAACDRAHRSSHAVRLEAGPALQGLSGEDAGRQGGLRIPAARRAPGLCPCAARRGDNGGDPGATRSATRVGARGKSAHRLQSQGAQAVQGGQRPRPRPCALRHQNPRPRHAARQLRRRYCAPRARSPR